MSNAMILRPQTFDQLVRFAEMAASSSMVPTAMRGKPQDIMLAVQMGSEVGLSPMQAIQNIAVINGRPAIWGDAMVGLCKTHPAWAGIKEMIDGTDSDMVAVCEVHRKGDNPVISTFSVDDAKRAGLWGKQGPWQQYPKRMMQMRARGFALRDAFPDALKGLISAEEARDIPPDTFTGTTIDAQPEPVTPPEPINTAPPAPKRKWSDVLAEIEIKAGQVQSFDGLDLLQQHEDVVLVREKGSDAVKARAGQLLGDAYNRLVEAHGARPVPQDEEMPA